MYHCSLVSVTCLKIHCPIEWYVVVFYNDLYSNFVLRKSKGLLHHHHTMKCLCSAFLLCYALLCCAVVCRAVLSVPWHAVLCCSVPWCALLCSPAFCCVLTCAKLFCALLMWCDKKSLSNSAQLTSNFHINRSRWKILQ